MLNRRHIRVKVLQLLYAYFHSDGKNIEEVEIELDNSFKQTETLYTHLLTLLVNLRLVAIDKIDKGISKLLPSQEDLNPNKRFVDNQVLRVLSQHKQLLHRTKNSHDFWSENNELQSKLFKQISGSDLYKDYMEASATGYVDDRKFVISLYIDFIASNESIHAYLEEKSLYWQDDFEIVNKAVIRLIKSLKQDDDSELPFASLFKDDEDHVFAVDLMKQTISNATEYKKYIIETASNWDEERISHMDQIIMQMAICELLNFNTIPVKVSLNEYIELSKNYSGKKSKVFINGVIDKLIKQFREDGRLIKIGRGLLE
jgi:N utilization substance protein B